MPYTSVAASFSQKQFGGELSACIALDFAAVGGAPSHKIIGIYDDFFRDLSTLFDFFDGRFDLAQPLLISWELGVDGLPSRPILFSQPRDRDIHLSHGRPPLNEGVRQSPHPRGLFPAHSYDLTRSGLYPQRMNQPV
jgi:hypothetical protein